MSTRTGFRRAMVLMTASSMLVPVIGVITAPVLAQSLGVAGRGEVAAAIAPGVLISSVATLGLPEALTFHLAKDPRQTRRALLFTSVISAAVGAFCLLAVYAFSGFLSGDDRSLSRLIVIGTALAVPILIVNLLRGAASGRQLWSSVALERVITSLLRLLGLGGLALLDHLDTITAILVMNIGPVVAGLVYARLLLRPHPSGFTDRSPLTRRALVSFGSKIWLGSVAAMLTGRLSQLLVTPLSDVRQLGVFVVAVTISDVPFIVATAVRDTIFGIASADADVERLASTTRIATVVALAGSLVLGVSVPFWIRPLFGPGFAAAVGPTWLLLASAVIGVPGLIAGAGLGSWGRPGLRSIGPGIALLTNLIGVLVFVPHGGAVGAAVAALLSTGLTSVFGVVAASRVTGAPVSSFVMPRSSDLAVLVEEGLHLLRLRRRSAT